MHTVKKQTLCMWQRPRIMDTWNTVVMDTWNTIVMDTWNIIVMDTWDIIVCGAYTEARVDPELQNDQLNI